MVTIEYRRISLYEPPYVSRLAYLTEFRLININDFRILNNQIESKRTIKLNQRERHVAMFKKSNTVGIGGKYILLNGKTHKCAIQLNFN